MNMLRLDVPTLLFVVALLSLMMGAVLLTSWRINRSVPGLREFSLATLCSFFAAATLALRAQLPELQSALVISLFMTSTAYLTLSACNSHVGKPAFPVAAPVLIIGLAVLATMALAYLRPLPGLRYIAISLVTSMLFIWSGKTIAVGGRERYPIRYMFAAACTLHGLFVTLRPWLRHALSDPTQHANDLGLPALFILESLVFLILLSIGAFMLANEHIANQLKALAEIDPLTSFFNRRAFMALFEKATSLSVRTASPLSVLAIDIDHFKQINDTWGHQSGDTVLRHFADLVSSKLRNEDLAGRLGGEEFAIFLPHASLAGASEIAERLRHELASEHVKVDGATVQFTVSIGVAEYEVGESPQFTLQRADQAMYRAKKAGRNQVEIARRYA